MTKPELVFETCIRAPADRVWQALTSAEFTSQYFFGTHVESGWQTGDPVRYRNSPEGDVAVEGEVLEADPPRRLVVTWRALYDEEAAREAPSRVTWEIEELQGQCRLRIVHDRFPDGSVMPGQVADGWPYLAASLKSLLETGEPLPPRRPGAAS